MLCKEQSWEILYKPPSSFSAPLKQLTEYPPELMLTSIYFFSYGFLNVSRPLALCWEKIPHSLQNVYVHSSDSYFIQIVLFSPLYLTLTWVMKYNFFIPVCWWNIKRKTGHSATIFHLLKYPLVVLLYVLGGGKVGDWEVRQAVTLLSLCRYLDF